MNLTCRGSAGISLDTKVFTCKDTPIALLTINLADDEVLTFLWEISFQESVLITLFNLIQNLFFSAHISIESTHYSPRRTILQT